MWRGCKKPFQQVAWRGRQLLHWVLAKSSPNKSREDLFHLPRTIEEIKEANEVSHALRFYNDFMPRTQYFKPHTANAKKFLNNAEFIRRQINIFNASKECISSFLRIEEKEFSKLLRYYSKPQVISIKNFISSKPIQQDLIWRSQKSLRSLLKQRLDN